MAVEAIREEILNEFLKLLENQIPGYMVDRLKEELKKEHIDEKSILEILST